MNYISYYDDTGKYTYITIKTGDEKLPAKGVYLGRVDIDKQYHDIKTDKPVDKPERPSYAHVFSYGTKKWEIEAAAAWLIVRTERARLLAKSDWVVTKALETGSSIDPEWASYRQALRDVTLQADPEQIQWPLEP
jgi:hypothetical protein